MTFCSSHGNMIDVAGESVRCKAVERCESTYEKKNTLKWQMENVHIYIYFHFHGCCGCRAFVSWETVAHRARHTVLAARVLLLSVRPGRRRAKRTFPPMHWPQPFVFSFISVIEARSLILFV